MKKFYLFTLIVVGYASALWSQPVFEIDNTTGDPGGVVSVNFKVRNFRSIVGMQFSIDWDETVLKYSSVSNISNAIRDFDASSINTDAKWTNEGNIIVSWFDTGAEPNTLPDGTIIFTLNFDIVGGSGSTTTVKIADSPRKIEIINNNEMNIGLSSSGGVFTASGTGGGATLRVIGSDEVGATGENVCVEVTVEGFTNINGMQFSLNWDPAFMRYTGVGAFNLNGLTEGTFNTDAANTGKIGLQWLDPSSTGITLASGTRIFQICFDILGSSGNRSVQFTNDPVAIEIIDGNDMRVTFAKKDGTITVEGGGGGSDCNAPGFALAASEENASAGGQICVDISVKGFTTVTSLSSTIEWNPAILNNPQISGVNLTGLAESNFNLDQGANGMISFVWIDPTTDGTTLADGVKIFEVCYDVVGSNGQMSTIRFTDGLAEREVSIGSSGAPFNQCDGSVTVGNGNNPLSASVTQPSCRGTSDGAINLAVNGGSSPYTYQWTKNSVNFATSQDLTNLGAGTYAVVVTDAAGAQFNFEVVLNNPAGAMITNATVVNPSGAGNNGSIALTISGGATPLTFAWSNGGTTRDLAGLGGGTYMLTITESNGCTLDTAFSLGSGELMVELTVEDVSCFGEDDGRVTAAASGGTGPYTYAWNNGETGNRISALMPGNYTVTVTDGAGAMINTSATVNEPDTLRVSINTTPSPNNIEGTATAVVTGGTAPYRYAWTDANRSTTRVVIGLPQGDIRVIVTDENGCQASRGDNIRESNRECFSAVPVMSPNGDGRNDYLNIACVEGLDNELEVYDRHGQLVFEATNYSNDWMGLNSSNELLPDGAYYWVIRVRKDGILEQHLGHLTILTSLN